MKNTSIAFFVDLDETLIRSTFCAYHKPATGKNSKLVKLKLAYSHETYQVVIHPESINLLKYLRSLTSNVFMLTAAIKPYAEKINLLFKLGFNKLDIFSREEIEAHNKRDLSDKLVNIDTFVLIDNLPSFSNFSKLEFLSSVKNNQQKYIQVNEFYSLTQKDQWTLDYIKKQIEA